MNIQYTFANCCEVHTYGTACEPTCQGAWPSGPRKPPGAWASRPGTTKNRQTEIKNKVVRPKRDNSKGLRRKKLSKGQPQGNHRTI